MLFFIFLFLCIRNNTNFCLTLCILSFGFLQSNFLSLSSLRKKYSKLNFKLYYFFIMVLHFVGIELVGINCPSMLRFKNGKGELIIIIFYVCVLVLCFLSVRLLDILRFVFYVLIFIGLCKTFFNILFFVKLNLLDLFSSVTHKNISYYMSICLLLIFVYDIVSEIFITKKYTNNIQRIYFLYYILSKYFTVIHIMIWVTLCMYVCMCTLYCTTIKEQFTKKNTLLSYDYYITLKCLDYET